jgi:hypothetical protein
MRADLTADDSEGELLGPSKIDTIDHDPREHDCDDNSAINGNRYRACFWNG